MVCPRAFVIAYKHNYSKFYYLIPYGKCAFCNPPFKIMLWFTPVACWGKSRLDFVNFNGLVKL